MVPPPFRHSAAAMPGVTGTSQQINGSGFVTRGAQGVQVSISGLEPGNNTLFMFKSRVLEPARLSGEAVLVHEPIDQVAEPYIRGRALRHLEENKVVRVWCRE